MSPAPDGTLNFPNSGPGLKIVGEPFIETIAENKWPNALKRGRWLGSRTAQGKMMTPA